MTHIESFNIFSPQLCPTFIHWMNDWMFLSPVVARVQVRTDAPPVWRDVRGGRTDVRQGFPDQQQTDHPALQDSQLSGQHALQLQHMRSVCIHNYVVSVCRYVVSVWSCGQSYFKCSQYLVGRSGSRVGCVGCNIHLSWVLSGEVVVCWYSI